MCLLASQNKGKENEVNEFHNAPSGMHSELYQQLGLTFDFCTKSVMN